MMAESTCVVTGGAGFIGCALSGGLVRRFDRVIVFDNLHPQIHASPLRPEALHPAIEFRHADVTSAVEWDNLVLTAKPRVIVHLAAETGTGQSLTEASRHGMVNVIGTTVMLDALCRHKHVPHHLVLTSSRAVYGEGAWRSNDGTIFYPSQRSREQLARGFWNFEGAHHLSSSAHFTQPHPTSIYGATKLAQEHILAAWAISFGAALTILRLQNVYGPGQSLINPYTGIVSLFARLARQRKSIPLYEDGLMLRDFVYIDDVAAALLASIDVVPRGITRFDVGSGKPTTIREIAEYMSRHYGAPLPHVSAAYRYGDVRHASCDISASVRELKWHPKWDLDKGLSELCVWVDEKLNSAP